MARYIFIAGLDRFHLAQLRTLRNAGSYTYHSLISYKKIKCGSTFPVRHFVESGLRTLRRFSGTVDAVVGFWDFPVSTALPLLQQPLGLIGPDLESVLKCEHKYWSRLQQIKVVPEMVPPFTLVDPYGSDPVAECQLAYPFWLKPVKAVLSHLGFLVTDEETFASCLEEIRTHIGRYAAPFNYILQHAEIPGELRTIDGYHCIAEGLISEGRQCTLEGYVQGEEVCIYGVVDSIRSSRYPSTFSRYQYPSILPGPVQVRMIEATGKVMKYIGYDNSPFNIEFFWDEATDTIKLLEINTRISKSHCPLFKMVDGEYHHSVMIDVALGRKPDFPHRQGPYKLAAKFMLRRYDDGVVTGVPRQKDLDRLKERFPDCELVIHVSEGTRLSELRDQDSYSYELADLYLGGDSDKDIDHNYQVALSLLPFTIDPIVMNR